jgi:DNA modification methylase
MESVLSVHSEKGSIRSDHPAVFPVQLPFEYIQSVTAENDIVIEPFCGSGTTMIACEELSRKCYGMELTPKYVDLIINRWETFTGQKAVKIS